MRLVLASASPRRAELLSAAGISFTVQPVNADESPRDHEGPDDYVRRVARAKAEAVGALPAGCVILTADTTVTIDGLILGKPRDDGEAAEMLARLAGRTHRVLTGIVLACDDGGAAGPRLIDDLAVTNVTFHPLTSEAIDWYVATGEPRDRAGAYAIQGLASRFVARLDGSYTNVVGLPVDLVCRHLLTLAPVLLTGEARATA